jgi:O-glycosyl hydrolase
MGHRLVRRRGRVVAIALALAVAAALTVLSVPSAFGLKGGLSLQAALGDAGLGSGPQSTHIDRSITINGALKSGPVFGGIGAISGGGGTGRLLMDYPEPEQQQILDYLFKPGYGANVQMLKIEIGGDAEATDAAEPSFEHTRGHINCNAGYEMWLAKQAVALNPNIKLYALQWNAPSWVGHGQENPWTQNDIDYLMSWMKCAKQAGLNIGYLGAWNERHLVHGVTPPIMQWFINLRAALNENGYSSTKIVAMDSHFYPCCDFAKLLYTHAQFRNAIGVLGYHDICKYPTTGMACFVPASARDSGKPVWATEIGALRPPGGSAAFARTINNAYIQTGSTAILEWPLVTSMPGGMPEEDRGLVMSSQPWSGYYQVSLVSWVMAQTTQFTEPGWVHVAGASGQFGGSWGTYVSYEGPKRTAWTTVAQTSTAPGPQNVTMKVTGGLPSSTVYEWSTNLKSSDPTTWMVNQTALAPITPTNGKFTATLQPGYIYTFTTSNVGQALGVEGSTAPTTPQATAQPMPWSSDVDPTATTWPQTAYGPDASGMPWGLEPADGSFEYPGGQTSYFEQTTVGRPDFWQPPTSSQIARFPYAVAGDYCVGDVPITKGTDEPSDCNGSVANYEVSTEFKFSKSDQSAGVIGRYYRPTTTSIQYFQGYRFTVSASGDWNLIRDSQTGAPVTLESGSVTALGTGGWHSISLTVDGPSLTGAIDGKSVINMPSDADGTYLNGIAGICTGGWYPVEFKDLTISPVS